MNSNLKQKTMMIISCDPALSGHGTYQGRLFHRDQTKWATAEELSRYIQWMYRTDRDTADMIAGAD